jgi:alpha-beta hydrolase superfamily lysophospholipase
LLATTGCFSLDPFLYVPKRVDQSAYLKGSVQPPRAYVIFFHGQGGNLDTQFERAKRWSNMGFDVLAFDYRGWGVSTDVTPTEEGILQDTQAVRAWMLQRIGPANAARLVYYGHSLGTATSTQLAEQAGPAALILESPFTSIRGLADDSSGMDFSPGFIARCRWATVDRVRNVHAPLLVLHGLADDYVRAEFSKEIFAAANEPKELKLVEGAHHSDIPETMGGAAYGELMTGFLDRALQP